MTTTLNTMLRNWWTTGVGFAGGLVMYLAEAGITFPPATRADWLAALKGLVIFALGFAAKSATTGSKPAGT